MESQASQAENVGREEKEDDALADASQMVGWGCSRRFGMWM